MSISGSQETKTAIFRSNTDGETVSLDAQENREIVGIQATLRFAADTDGQMTATARLFMGTDPQPGFGEATDNRGLYARYDVGKFINDAGGTGGMTDMERNQWFGHGSGVEWNEDVTLNMEVTHGGAGGLTAEITVFYHEL